MNCGKVLRARRASSAFACDREALMMKYDSSFHALTTDDRKIRISELASTYLPTNDYASRIENNGTIYRWSPPQLILITVIFPCGNFLWKTLVSPVEAATYQNGI